MSRAEASIEQLKELNLYVTVEIWKGELTPEGLSVFNVVILTDVWNQQYITEVNEAVRAKNHGFIYGHSSGLFGSVFVDYGNVIICCKTHRNSKCSMSMAKNPREP